MAADIVANLFSTVFSLLWASFWYSIPVFLLLFLVNPIHRFFRERFKQTWVLASLASTYVIVLALLIVAYLAPAFSAANENDLGFAPAALAPSFGELVLSYVAVWFRLLLLAVFFAVLLLPAEFLGVFWMEWFSKRVKNRVVARFLSVWLTVLIVVGVVLFALPWIIPGLLYLIYWA